MTSWQSSNERHPLMVLVESVPPGMELVPPQTKHTLVDRQLPSTVYFDCPGCNVYMLRVPEPAQGYDRLVFTCQGCGALSRLG